MLVSPLVICLSFHCPINTFICPDQLNHHLLWSAFPTPSFSPQHSQVEVWPLSCPSRVLSPVLLGGEVVHGMCFLFTQHKAWHRVSIKWLWNESIKQAPSNSMLKSIFLILIVMIVLLAIRCLCSVSQGSVLGCPRKDLCGGLTLRKERAGKK